MNYILSWFVQTTIASTIMLMVTMLVCRAFRDRPSVQHMLWLIVLLKFVTPSIFTVNLPISELTPISATVSIDSHFSQIEADNSPSNEPREWAVILPETIALPEQLYSASSTKLPLRPLEEVEPQVKRRELILASLLAIWLGGSIAVAWRLARRIQRQLRVLRLGREAPSHLTILVRDVAERLRQRTIPVLVVPGTASPYVWCFGKLTLIWPERMVDGPMHTSTPSIIAHELSHVRRRDHWVAWIEMAAMLMWWWNPMFWLVRKNLRETAEMACDALAIAAFPHDRCVYAENLLSISADSKSGVPELVLAVGTGTPSSFERRMSMIVSERVSGKLSLLGILTAVCLTIAGVSNWSLAQQVSVSEKVDLKLNEVQEQQAVDAKPKQEGVPNENRNELAPAIEKKIVAANASGELETKLPKNTTTIRKTPSSLDPVLEEYILTGKFDEARRYVELLRAKKSRQPQAAADPNRLEKVADALQQFDELVGSGGIGLSKRVPTELASKEKEIGNQLAARRAELERAARDIARAKAEIDQINVATSAKAGGSLHSAQAKTDRETSKLHSKAATTSASPGYSASVEMSEPVVWTALPRSENSLNLADRYLRAVADLKLARWRLTRAQSKPEKESEQLMEEHRIEIERAEKQVGLLSKYFAHAKELASHAHAYAESELDNATALVARSAGNLWDVEKAKHEVEKAKSVQKHLETIMEFIQIQPQIDSPTKR